MGEGSSMVLDLPPEIITNLLRGYLVLLASGLVMAWALMRMRSAATDFRHRRELEDTERLYGGN